MRAPYFSIVTVTKNNLSGLQQTALSIAAQSNDAWRDFEWIVIDGNSDDGTDEFLKTTNALWFSAPDDGLYDAMNKGIERSNGVYVIFMNAGDIFASDNTLNIIQDHIEEPLPDMVYGDALEDNGKGHEFYKQARNAKEINKGLFTHHQALFYKREKIADLRYDLTYKLAADYDFTFKFLKQNPYAEYIKEPICLFESGGLSQKNAAQSRREEFNIRKKYGVAYTQNLKTYLRQTIASWVKTICAPLYWFIRERI